MSVITKDYIESRIIKNSTHNFNWVIDAPLYQKMDRNGSASSITEAFILLKKKIFRTDKIIGHYINKWAILYRDLSIDDEKINSKYFYTQYAIKNGIIISNDDTKPIEINCDENIKMSWRSIDVINRRLIYISEPCELLADTENENKVYDIYSMDTPYDLTKDDIYDDEESGLKAADMRFQNMLDEIRNGRVSTPFGLYIDPSTERQKDIVCWLEDSIHAQQLANKPGFFVKSGKIVSLKSGEKIEVIKWLKSEGFMKIKSVLNYNISYNPEGEKYGESLTFFSQDASFIAGP